MATHSSILAWRTPWTAEPGGLMSMGSHRVRHNWSNIAAAAKQESLSYSLRVSWLVRGRAMIKHLRTPLVVQWIRLHLPVLGPGFGSWSGSIHPTCRGATEPVHPLLSPSDRAQELQLPKHSCLEPAQWEGWALQPGAAPDLCSQRKLRRSNKDPGQPKVINKWNLFKDECVICPTELWETSVS